MVSGLWIWYCLWVWVLFELGLFSQCLWYVWRKCPCLHHIDYLVCLLWWCVGGIIQFDYLWQLTSADGLNIFESPMRLSSLASFAFYSSEVLSLMCVVPVWVLCLASFWSSALQSLFLAVKVISLMLQLPFKGFWSTYHNFFWNANFIVWIVGDY